MSIFIGSSEPSKIFVGGSEVASVRAGDTKVRPTVTPITTPGIYRNETKGLISLSGDGSNWYTIADKNLGATTVYNSGDTLSETNCGKYYQWGNNYGFPRSGSVSTSSSTVNASNYGPNNYYSSSTWRTATQWDSSNNLNLRGGTTGTNEAMKGPCDTGFHISNNTELSGLLTMWQTITGKTASNISDFSTHLKIPFAGYRNRSNGTKTASGAAIGLWASNASGTSAYYMYGTLNGSTILNVTLGNKGFGYNIRPFKNDTVQPDNSWDIIYQKESGNLMSYSDFITYWDNNGYTAAQNKLNEYPTEYYNKYNSEGHIVTTGGQQRLDHYDSLGVFMYWNGTTWYAS